MSDIVERARKHEECVRLEGCENHDLILEMAAEIERLRLLSSPRMEEVRREALEEAAEVPPEPTNAMLEPANMIEPMRESLRQILADMPTPLCEHLHHAREDQHRFDQECPVEKRLNAAITKGNTAFGKDKP